MIAADTKMAQVYLVDFPVGIHARAEEHTHELLREFAHIANSDARTTERIPERLLALVSRLQIEYEPFTGATRKVLEQARAEGRQRIDLAYQIPRGAKEGIAELARAFDEADRYCESGDLLTLATPPELVRFRNWFLEEFIRQSNGEPPTPWTEVQASDRF